MTLGQQTRVTPKSRNDSVGDYLPPCCSRGAQAWSNRWGGTCEGGGKMTSVFVDDVSITSADVRAVVEQDEVSRVQVAVRDHGPVVLQSEEDALTGLSRLCECVSKLNAKVKAEDMTDLNLVEGSSGFSKPSMTSMICMLVDRWDRSCCRTEAFRRYSLTNHFCANVRYPECIAKNEVCWILLVARKQSPIVGAEPAGGVRRGSDDVSNSLTSLATNAQRRESRNQGNRVFGKAH